MVTVSVNVTKSYLKVTCCSFKTYSFPCPALKENSMLIFRFICVFWVSTKTSLYVLMCKEHSHTVCLYILVLTLSLKRSVLAPVSLRRPRKGRSALIGQNNDCALLLPSDGLIQQVFCGWGRHLEVALLLHYGKLSLWHHNWSFLRRFLDILSWKIRRGCCFFILCGSLDTSGTHSNV